MKFQSTRGQAPILSFSAAAQEGLAPDGGLYVPEHFPSFKLEEFRGLDTLPQIASKLLTPFFVDDVLAGDLAGICTRAFDFAIPLRNLDSTTSVLELFHGPTAAFKDIGARFLAECFMAQDAHAPRAGLRRTIAVATSGDTGGAVAAAFHRKPGCEVVVLFPKGRVSERQQKQLTCWGDNVRSFSVRGNFDDCQRLVKESFADTQRRAARQLTSANSINVGRLLPQMAYYAAASLRSLHERGRASSFVIPTGNVGNAVAALWAKKVGMPIDRIVMATNANRTVPDFFASGNLESRVSIATHANAMDVGNPSNMERVRHLYPAIEELRSLASAISVDDETIRRTIHEGFTKSGEIWCPHTATAIHVRGMQKTGDWVVVATAHPAKFNVVVEPLIGRTIDVPPSLAELIGKPSLFSEIDPKLDAIWT